LLQLTAWAALYVLCGYLSIGWVSEATQTPRVWLPAGVASAGAVLLGWRALLPLAVGGSLLAALQL